MHYLCLILIFGCLSTVTTAGTTNTSFVNAARILKGVWTNELGSTLNITGVFKPSMTIRGTYASPSGTSGQQFSLTGAINFSPMVSGKHNVIVVSFTVHWGTIGSVTTWNGFYSEGDYDDKESSSGTIIAQWLLVRPITNYKWDHVLTGQDRFTKRS